MKFLKDKKILKKFDPISFALVLLLGASAVFSAVQIFGNRDDITVAPPVTNGDDVIVVDKDQKGETIPTTAKGDESDNTEGEIVKSPIASEDIAYTTRYYSDTVSEDEQTQRFFYFTAGNSLYSHESKGVSLKLANNEKADVVASLSGTVTSVKDEILRGTVVTIDCGNEIQTVYTGVYDVKVAEGDEVKQGDTIGSTGLSQREPEAGNVIHFEIIKDGSKINPETAFEKNTKEL